MRSSSWSAAIVLALLTSCSPARPVGPGFEPDAREQRLWDATREMSAELQSSGKLYPDSALQQYVQSVLERLLGPDRSAYAPLHPRVFILDAPSINAFTFPHGDIFVHTGILGRMRSEAQLAMLLGHELTHATRRHTTQELHDAYVRTAANAYVGVLSSLAGNYGDAVSTLGSLMTVAAITGYSREKEAEADSTGLMLVAHAGYDPREAAEMFRRMLAATDRAGRSFNFFYSTHPAMQDRVDSCARLTAKLTVQMSGTAADLGQDPYLAAARPLILAEVKRHIAQGKYALAEETVLFLIDHQPADAEAYAQAGDLYRSRHAAGDPDRAELAYRKALDIDPAHSAAHRGLGLLFGSTGRPAPAMDHLRKYLEANPDAPDASYVRQYVAQLEKGG